MIGLNVVMKRRSDQSMGQNVIRIADCLPLLRISPNRCTGQWLYKGACC